MVLNIRNRIDYAKDLQKLIWKWCNKNPNFPVFEIGVNADHFSVKTLNPRTNKYVIISLDNELAYEKNKGKK